MSNDITPHLNLPLPHPDSLLETDVERLRTAFVALDEYAGTANKALATKAEAQAVAEALAIKADAATVETALAKLEADKANKTAMQQVQSTADEARSAATAAQAAADAAQATANAAKAVTDAVGVSPAAHNIPRAGVDGKLAPGWVKATAAYELCEFYYFRHPTLRPGFQPAQGGLLVNAATLYPEAWAYLQTVEGQKLCTTEPQWQAMTTATWATLADGSRVGWNGIGGAPYYAPNTATGALRLPDLRGMYVEAAGFDSLGVGGVHGDGTREITGSVLYTSYVYSGAGALTVSSIGGATAVTSDYTYPRNRLSFEASRVVPVANKVQPRAWGALACCYLGMPAS